MIETKKQENAIKALQVVIIRARTMAYQKHEYNKIADILDGAEYLASLIYRKDDKTGKFREYLEQIAKKHSCLIALDKFDGVN